MSKLDSSGWQPPTHEKALRMFIDVFGKTDTILSVDQYPRNTATTDPTEIQRRYISPDDIASGRAIIRLRPAGSFHSWIADTARDPGPIVAQFDSIEEMVGAGWFGYSYSVLARPWSSSN